MQKKKKLNKSKLLAKSEQAQILEIQYSLALVAGGLVVAQLEYKSSCRS